MSLFGLDSLDAFKLQILIQLDKQLGIFECIKKWLSKAELSVKQISFSMPYIEVNLKKQIEKKAKEGQIYIVIDDIERKSCKIKMSEVLGVIEEFKEINNVNIIMIANESEIKDKTYYKFKEKVIQKTYKVTEFSLTAKEAILQKYAYQIEQIKENNALFKCLEEFYTKHSLKNLRTMEKSLIFLKYIFANINLSNMTEQDMRKLIIVSLAVAVEKIERLYISIEEQKDVKNTIFSEQLRSLEGCILKNYLKEMVIGNNNQTLIEIIINIYNDENVEQNFQNISEFFENVHKFGQSNTDEPLFYKSEERLRLSIQKFYELNIKITDPSLDIDSWFKKFAEVYIYILKK